MKNLTLDDIRTLAVVYDNNAIPSGLTPEQMEKYREQFSYTDFIEVIIEEKKTPEDSLMEFIGAYDNVVYDHNSWQNLFNFLFHTPISEMPIHINDDGPEEWRSKVAKWRLSIKK